MKGRNRWGSKKSRNPVVQLSMISLMDIFTILLLFLLVNMGTEGIVLPSSDELKLPASTSQNVPKTTVTLMVTEKEIFVEGTKMMEVAKALKQNKSTLLPVRKELKRLAERTRQVASKNSSVAFTGNITIMGDRQIPFHLLKKLMTTSAQAGYPHIALAVIQKEGNGE